MTIAALLIEDDERLARFTVDYLVEHEVFVTHILRGDEGLAEANRKRYDVVILDLMLPGLDGISVCQKLRAKSDVPVLMLTARGEESDRVVGLEIGADDYLVKPYSPRELLARIRAIVRRERGELGPVSREIKVGPLTLSTTSRQATLEGQDLSLTTYEFELLLALAQRPGRVLSREQLLDIVKGNADEAFDRSVDVHISRLRQKMGDQGRQAKWLKTVRGVGYMLALQPDAMG